MDFCRILMNDFQAELLPVATIEAMSRHIPSYNR